MRSELQQLITEIPVAERREIRGIMGFRWTPTQRITLNFYLINSLRMRSSQFFLCEGAELDVLISNNYLAAIREEEASRTGRMLMLTEVPLTDEQRAAQQALIQNQNARSLDYARSRDRRLALERARQRGQILPPPPARTPGRVWTIQSNVAATTENNDADSRAITAGPSPGTLSRSSTSMTRDNGNNSAGENFHGLVVNGSVP
ncbi:hypothetical protein MMC11_006755 [Xylographa trunciseda]|nr:hypothetical protein [Xylographa trunciseda]